MVSRSASSHAVPGTDVTLHHYRLPSENGEGWAIITIGTDGTFAALSDYGNWSYAGWSHHGCGDIRRFFLRERRSDSYLITKLCSGHPRLLHLYDGEATVKRIREAIIQHRRDGSFDARQARREWDLIEDLEVQESELAFGRWFDATNMGDAHEFCCSQPDPQCVAFVEKVLLSDRFQQMLADHIAESAAATAGVSC